MSIIKTKQIAEKIAEISGLSIEEVEKELIAFIVEASSVSKGNPLTIEGLGTFRLKRGRLSFESDPAFAVEINYKYAGMQPIEIGKETGTTVEENNKENETDSSEEQAKKREQEEPELVIGKVTEQKEALEKPTSDAESKEEIQPTPTKEENLEPVKSEEEKPQKPESEQSVSKKVLPQPKPSLSNNQGVLLMIVAAVVLVLLMGWYLMRNNKVAKEISNGEQVEISQTEQIQVETKAKPLAESEQSTKAETVVQDIVDDLTQSQEQKPSFQPVDFGLKGAYQPEIETCYSLIIYTLSVESRAYAEVSEWSKKGFKAYVHQLERKNRTLYYVALGQFETLNAAKQAVSDLPEKFRDTKNHAIQRITR